jgi:hypothetical protein
LQKQSTSFASLGWLRNTFHFSSRVLGFGVTAWDNTYISISVFSVNSVRKGMNLNLGRKVWQEGEHNLASG